MADTVIGSAAIELELKQQGLDRKLDDVERKVSANARKLENTTNGALDGVAKMMLNVVAAAGTMEAGFRAAGAAVAIANGDMEAAESALRAIPGGVGAAASALIDLKRIIDADTEATIRFKEAMLDMGRAAGDTAGLDSLQKFMDELNRKIAEFEGRQVDSTTLRVFDHRREIDTQIQAFQNLRMELEGWVRDSEKANVRLERIDMAAGVRALREGELGRGAMGLLSGAAFSFGQVDDMTRYNTLIDSLREAGITAETSNEALEQIERRMASLGEKSEQLIRTAMRLRTVWEEQQQAEQQAQNLRQREESFERETAMEESLHRRLELLREEDDFERRRIAIRHQLEDRLQETSSRQLRRMIREEADLRLRAIDEEERRRKAINAMDHAGMGGLRGIERSLAVQAFSMEEFRRLLPGAGGAGGRQEVRDESVRQAVEQVRDAVIRAINNPRVAVFG